MGIKRESSPKIKLEVASKQDNYPASCYQPLGEGEFRILKLGPGESHDTDVYCSLITASMAQAMKYEAVSYLWGATSQQSMKINLVDSVGKAHPIYIRSHLFDALRSLRHPTIHRRFWVDALCINHGSGDSVDKNTQTAMKRYIFQNAKNLCFWIGEDENYKKALNFIPNMLDLTNINKLVRDGNAIDGWVSFMALLQNPVFSRLWLVQEVAVSRNVTLHSGVTAIHYADLVDAVAMFRSFRGDISLLFRRNGRNYKELLDRRISIAERFIEVSTNSLRTNRTMTYVEPGIRERRHKTERLLSLEELVSYLSQLTSTSPLDRIYSVLAIASDGPDLDERTLMDSAPETQIDSALKIDYEAKVADVYQRFVLRAIENSRSLDIICRKWADSASDCNLPTWIRPIECSLPLSSDILDRTNAESLVGLPEHKFYNASRGTVPTFSAPSPQSSESPRSLFVRGLHIDTISELGPRAEDGIILREWLELAQCDVTQKEVPEAFWRTLVADRDPHGTFAPSWYRIAFLYCLLNSPTGNINTHRLIVESEPEPSLIVDFLFRVQSVIWNRKFLVSKNRNYFGLAPMVAQVGDSICILFGCTVPVVLRRCEDDAGAVYFQLVGESYVHRIMDGEALAAGYPEEEFELR